MPAHENPTAHSNMSKYPDDKEESEQLGECVLFYKTVGKYDL